MIQGFVDIVKNDATLLYKQFQQSWPAKSKQQNEIINRATVRLFATFGMAVGVVVGIKAFSAASTLGALTNLAVATGLYALSHDVFVMAWNHDKQILEQVKDLGKNLLDIVKDKLDNLADPSKAKKIKSTHFYTQDTLLRPLWDAIL